MKPAAVSSDDRSGMCRALRLASVESVALDQAGQWAWMEHAACRGVGAAEFFGSAAGGGTRCRACPVAEACFWWAMVAEADVGYRFGIWGGATPAVRAQVAWVTGVDYVRARFAVCAAQWARGAVRSAAEPTLIVDRPGDDRR